MQKMILHPIGKISVCDGKAAVVLDEEYAPALTGLEGFSCVQILWWFDGCDNENSRTKLTMEKPYRHGPDDMGTFATRSPERPNPIALSCAFVTGIDRANGIVHLAYIDAFDGSPVLDVKPYTPSLDRVEAPQVPDWCGHWPDSVEKSGEFDWEAEFNF
jgi:tRNA-Thr(GGU) m(6)t(6)A37 methyltransferase TsaA